MAKKEQILNNIREYSATDLVDLIRTGDITLYELSKSGALTPLMRKRIEEQLTKCCSEQELSKDEYSCKNNIVDQDKLIRETEEINKMDVNDIPKTTPIDITPTIEHNVIVEGTHNMDVSDISETSSIITPPIVEHNITTEDINDNTIGNDIIENNGMFHKVFSFKGRIRRLEYGLSYIIFSIWYAFFTAISESYDINPLLAVITLLSTVPAYWFLWAQGAKRCHDRGNSGWYQIIPFYVFVMIFGKGEDGINDYGTNPKE